jgi:hypothetical protein
MSENEPDCPSSLTLERYLAEELPVEGADARHVASCPRCSERLVGMKHDGDAYMASSDAADVRRLLAEERTPAPTRRRRWWAVAAPGLAAAAAVSLLVVVHRPTVADLTSKGGSSVELLVGHEGRVAPWDGRALVKGDELQLVWTGAEVAYVAVVGREDSGETAAWFPAPPERRAARLEPGRRAVGGGLLFDPPFHGSVHVYVGREPFAVPPLEAAIRAGGSAAFLGDHRIIVVPPSAP